MIELPSALGLDALEDAEPREDSEVAERRLPEGYYAANFLRLLDTVAARYDDLLAPRERSFIERLRRLDEPSRRLYVRLVMRKGPLFRRDLLRYAEIEDLGAALAELEASGLVDDGCDDGCDDGHRDGGDGASLEDLLALLRRGELVELLRELGLSGAGVRGRREKLLAELSALDVETVEDALRRRFEVIRPLGLEVLWLFRLLFFGNLEQDWREFMLADLGVHRYEDYPLSRETRLFSQRRAALETLEMGLLRRELRRLLARPGRPEEEALEAAVEIARSVARASEPEGEASRGQARNEVAWRHGERILAKVGRELERAQRLEESLELYEAASLPPCRERRCRVLARLEREQEALELAEQIAVEPLDEAETAFAPRFAHLMRRKLGRTREKWRRAKRPVVELEVESAVLEAPRPAVEWLALALLEERGRRGVYSENWLWRSLFGLAFWDVIFAPLPGVFAHPFQLGPLDLQSSDFHRRRRASIAARLDELRREADLEARLLPVYEEKYGTSNAFVAWQPQLEESLRFAMRHVPGWALAVVCERLARDPGRHRRGLPDLLVLAEESPAGVELLEVKAPGDQLRPEQGAWIDHLNASALPAKILRITAR